MLEELMKNSPEVQLPLRDWFLLLQWILTMLPAPMVLVPSMTRQILSQHLS